MSFQNLAPCLSQVEVALKQCLAALNAEHPVSVSALSETIGHCANALNQLQPIISQLVKQEDSLLSIIATAHTPATAATRSSRIQAATTVSRRLGFG